MNIYCYICVLYHQISCFMMEWSFPRCGLLATQLPLLALLVAITRSPRHRLHVRKHISHLPSADMAAAPTGNGPWSKEFVTTTPAEISGRIRRPGNASLSL